MDSKRHLDFQQRDTIDMDLDDNDVIDELRLRALLIYTNIHVYLSRRNRLTIATLQPRIQHHLRNKYVYTYAKNKYLVFSSMDDDVRSAFSNGKPYDNVWKFCSAIYCDIPLYKLADITGIQDGGKLQDPLSIYAEASDETQRKIEKLVSTASSVTLFTDIVSE